MNYSIQKFQNALSDAERQVLQLCLQEAMQAVPDDTVPWYLGNAASPTGYLKPEHAKVLLSLRQDWLTEPQGLRWDTPEKTPASRSLALAKLAAELSDLGHVTGWRNEKFSYWPDTTILANGHPVEPTNKLVAAFELERAAYRFWFASTCCACQWFHGRWLHVVRTPLNGQGHRPWHAGQHGRGRLDCG